jgi:Zn-finger in Ran binding protein and others
MSSSNQDYDEQGVDHQLLSEPSYAAVSEEYVQQHHDEHAANDDHQGRDHQEDHRAESYEPDNQGSGDQAHSGDQNQQSSSNRMVRKLVTRQATDWDCPSCNELNFGKRMECYKCKHPRYGNNSQTGDRRRPSNQMNSNDRTQPRVPRERRPGDWDCSCGKYNFENRSHCFYCRAPKPLDASVFSGYSQQQQPPIRGHQQQYQAYNGNMNDPYYDGSVQGNGYYGAPYPSYDRRDDRMYGRRDDRMYDRNNGGMYERPMNGPPGYSHPRGRYEDDGFNRGRGDGYGYGQQQGYGGGQMMQAPVAPQFYGQQSMNNPQRRERSRSRERNFRSNNGR